ALGLTILICGALGFGILLAGMPVASFYGIPDLAGIFAILSISFFVAPYISIPMSLLARDMEFGTQFYIRVTATIVNAIAVVGLIFLGFSYFSLAIARAMAALTQFFMLLWIRPVGMQYIPRFRGMKPIASFGIFNSLALVARKAQYTLPDMIIGKMGSTGQVGMFSRGLGFIQFVSETVFMGVQPVALPYMAQVRRKGEEIKAAYMKASVLLGAFLIPVLGVASLSALPAIRLMFGDQWDAAAPVAAWLAVWAMLRSFHWFTSPMLMAIGREGVMLAREVLPFLLLIPAIIVTFSGGLQSIAKGFVMVGVIELLVTTFLVMWQLKMSLSEFLQAWLSTMAVGALCIAATLVILFFLPATDTPAWMFIGVEALVLPPVWLGALFLTRNPLANEIHVAYQETIKKIGNARKS
ncbi:hypothetical protein CF392_16025, partial [Tamilnaduibacter salinus]